MGEASVAGREVGWHVDCEVTEPRSLEGSLSNLKVRKGRPGPALPDQRLFRPSREQPGSRQTKLGSGLRFFDSHGSPGIPHATLFGADETFGGADETFGGADATLAGADETFGGADETFGGEDATFGGADATLARADETFGRADETFGRADETFGRADATLAGAGETFDGEIAIFLNKTLSLAGLP